MPIYEYRCSSCRHELEALQKFSDAPLVKCPSCGAETLVKQVSAAGFQLKGSGWYVTDFRGGAKSGKTEGGTSSESAKPTEASNGSDAKDTKSDSTTKSEAKSDTKSDTSSSTPPAKSGNTTATT